MLLYGMPDSDHVPVRLFLQSGIGFVFHHYEQFHFILPCFI